MAIRIATCNANNLFSRWSFQTDLPRVEEAVATLHGNATEVPSETAASAREPASPPDVVHIRLDDGTVLTGVLRTYRGKLVRGKEPKARAWLASRIAALDADVLCLQEVEDQNALDVFHRDELQPRGIDYPYRVVVEGNDPRRIDVAVCSRLPITRVSSWRFWPGPEGDRVFSRDLLQIECATAAHDPLRIFVNHLKSNFIADEFRLSEEELTAQREATARRRRWQVEAITAILRHQRLTRRVVVLGDMNDEPDGSALTALTEAGLSEHIHGATTIPGPDRHGVLIADKFSDLHPGMWTHRFRGHGETHFGLYDQIWTSQDVPVAAAYVMRRTQISGDGTDHDPACVDLDL